MTICQQNALGEIQGELENCPIEQINDHIQFLEQRTFVTRPEKENHVHIKTCVIRQGQCRHDHYVDDFRKIMVDALGSDGRFDLSVFLEWKLHFAKMK